MGDGSHDGCRSVPTGMKSSGRGKASAWVGLIGALVSFVVAVLAWSAPATAATYDPFAPKMATITPGESLWGELGCGTPYTEVHFTIKSGNVRRLDLLVHHTPGRFGTIEVKEKIDGRFDLKWQWRQPWDWIWGTQYRIESPHLSGGDYIVQYWSDNYAQDKLFCSSVVYVMSTSGDLQSVIRRWDGSLLPF
jgi:hypothetical protein